ncbi:MAG: hypothetical protein L0229_17200 [Blastocatellia bacterium]|nr:hypothetical protein [Blastocatellia bacterium]
MRKQSAALIRTIAKAMLNSSRGRKMTPMPEVKKQYVITQMGQGYTLAGVLEDYPGITVLDRLGNSTVLVEMTESTCRKITQDHPEMLIEANLTYELQS